MVLTQVFRQGPVTFHRIQGAIAAYLLLGLAWANAYELIELARPGALRFPDGGGPTPIRLIYFSFVTLTTVGYGDITPLHPTARSLAISEALVGQLFPAILIARLVSMEIASRSGRTDGSRGNRGGEAS
jgi:voltage-gated potassium channel Kch